MDPIAYKDRNDADADVVCGEADSCECEDESDADAAVVCGDADSREQEDESDAQSGVVCGDVDSSDYVAQSDAYADVLDSYRSKDESDADKEEFLCHSVLLPLDATLLWC